MSQVRCRNSGGVTQRSDGVALSLTYETHRKVSSAFDVAVHNSATPKNNNGEQRRRTRPRRLL
jgi:hypothetical protein